MNKKDYVNTKECMIQFLNNMERQNRTRGEDGPCFALAMIDKEPLIVNECNGIVSCLRARPKDDGVLLECTGCSKYGIYYNKESREVT